MSNSLTTPAPLTERSFRVAFLRRGLRTFVICLVIGALLSVLGNDSWWSATVHSVCTGLLCWLCIDLGRLPIARWANRRAAPGSSEARRLWPGWPLMLIVVGVGTLISFALGNVIARLLLGQSRNPLVVGNWHDMAALLIAVGVPGLVMTYYFYSGETIQAQEAAVQTAQRHAAEHQLKLLESQLEPHMLFNTLATLRVLIGSDPKRAQAMLDQLIAFMRATLGASRVAQHPLRLEFARLNDYLALMRIRMGERLQASFDLPDALAELPVPPLLLQPLVENSIKHGLEPKVSGGRLAISAERDGRTLVLMVRDTGNGLGPSSADGTRFGLVQVRERLATLYGAAASLTLVNADDAEGGTLATIRIPLLAA